MPIFGVVKGSKVDVKLWAPLEEVESAALQQLRNTASLPWAFHSVCAMPDVHLGSGATVGSVVALKEAVSPACVGVDIGCGMTAVKTNLHASDMPESLKALRLELEAAIPMGFNGHTKEAWDQFESTRHIGQDLFSRFNGLAQPEKASFTKTREQCGTLGGGNHYLSIALEQNSAKDPAVWLMLHSGSRGIGNQLAQHHIAIAKKMAHNADLPDKDLAVFLASTSEFSEFWRDLRWAQEYAHLNREVMLELFKKILTKNFPTISFGDPVRCHHNYVEKEWHYDNEVIVTRKGAISARKGQLGVIPGSMGMSSFIVSGLGNPESFMSASHGAGRKMSRTAARKKFTLEDMNNQLGTLESRRDVDIIDECPESYKNIHDVMANQSDLVEIVTEIKEILCCKG